MRILGMAVVLSMAVAGTAGAQNQPTPRTTDGHPDLTGVWRPGPAGGGGARGGQDDDLVIEQHIGSRRCHPGQRVEGLPKGRCINQTLDQEFIAEAPTNGEVVFSGRWDPSKPLYKPEFWDRIQWLDQNTNTEDPVVAKCQPLGIPRLSIPAPGRDGGMARIIQLPGEIIIFYAGSNGISPSGTRMIPTDGRKHTENDYEAASYWGRAVGRWEGDTLVIDSVGFNDLMWLERGGLFHSDKLHVIERLRRDGDVLYYTVTVEDPEVLLAPWVMPERRLRLNTNPNARFVAESGTLCSTEDIKDLFSGSNIRH